MDTDPAYHWSSDITGVTVDVIAAHALYWPLANRAYTMNIIGGKNVM